MTIHGLSLQKSTLMWQFLVSYAQMLVTDDRNNYRVINGQVQRGDRRSVDGTKDELPLGTQKPNFSPQW